MPICDSTGKDVTPSQLIRRSKKCGLDFNAGHGRLKDPTMARSRVAAFAIKEFKELIPPTLFFAVSFNIIVLTTQLILDDYFVRFASFLIATTAALVVGKAVLLANALPLMRRFDRGPLIWPIMFKTMVYFVAVFVVRFLEKVIEYTFSGGTLAGIPEYLTEHFTWHRFAAIQIWIFVLFLIYVTATEVSTLFGDGELVKILFRGRSSDLKLTRAAQSAGAMRSAPVTDVIAPSRAKTT
jgi:hypothetical protein